MQQRRDERSLGELFGDLARETSTLVRQEVQLAKTEMSKKRRESARISACSPSAARSRTRGCSR